MYPTRQGKSTERIIIYFKGLFLKVLVLYFQRDFSVTSPPPMLCLLSGIHSHSQLLLLSGLLFYPLDKELLFSPHVKMLSSLMAAWILTILISQNLCCFYYFSFLYLLFLHLFYYGCHTSSTHFTSTNI